MIAAVMLVCLCVHIAHGFDILTTSISPPTTPVMQGETVTIKVILDGEMDEKWFTCFWYYQDDKDNSACKQTRPSKNGTEIECDVSPEYQSRFPTISGGIVDGNTPKICQLIIGDVNCNHTGKWTVEVTGGDGSHGGQVNRTTWIHLQSTRLAEVTTNDESKYVPSGENFDYTCEAAFGVPKPVGFRWQINGDTDALNNWRPCFGRTDYVDNVTQSLSLTAPFVPRADFTLTCISLQYFDQDKNGTLGRCDGSENDDLNCTNKASFTIHVTAGGGDNGENTTLLATPWLITVIVGGALLLLFTLLLIWTCCTKTLCFKPKDHNNNLVRDGGGAKPKIVSNEKQKTNEKDKTKLQKSQISLVENSAWKFQGQTSDYDVRNTGRREVGNINRHYPEDHAMNYNFSTSQPSQRSVNRDYDGAPNNDVYHGYVSGHNVADINNDEHMDERNSGYRSHIVTNNNVHGVDDINDKKRQSNGPKQLLRLPKSTKNIKRQPISNQDVHTNYDAQINNQILPVYPDHPPATGSRSNWQTMQQQPYVQNHHGNINQGFEFEDEHNDKDEVIYAKPSFEYAPPRASGSTTIKIPLASVDKSLKHNELGSFSNGSVESTQQSTNPSFRTTLTQQHFKNKANAVYQNENLTIPSISNMPPANSLARQNSEYSSYSLEKDTLV